MSILDWLDNFFQAAAGSIGNAIASAVHWALRGITSLIMGVFRTVTAAWNDLFGAVKTYVTGFEQFVDATYNQFRYTLLVRIPALIHWASASLARLLAFLTALARKVAHDVAALIARITAAVHALYEWVLQHVWAPLLAFAKKTYADLLKWGYFAWFLLTHLPTLADMLIMHLAVSAEKRAWDLAGMLGTFLTALIVRNLRRVAVLLEDIITAVL